MRFGVVVSGFPFCWGGVEGEELGNATRLSTGEKKDANVDCQSGRRRVTGPAPTALRRVNCGHCAQSGVQRSVSSGQCARSGVQRSVSSGQGRNTGKNACTPPGAAALAFRSPSWLPAECETLVAAKRAFLSHSRPLTTDT